MKSRFFIGILVAANLAAGAALSASPSPSLASAKPDAHGIKRMAVLRGLDKITGRAVEISAPAGVPVHFGTLTITAQYCYTVPPEEPPETTAFLQIDDGTKRLFSGWMFASTPALSALEHPVYDVWVITCKTDEPARASASAATPATRKAESAIRGSAAAKGASVTPSVKPEPQAPGETSIPSKE